MEAINLGPFAISVRLLLFIAAAMLAVTIGNRVAKRLGTDIERSFWAILFVSLLSARLAFVLIYRESYGAAPWTVFDLRDGGLNATVGIVGALAMAAILAWRQREQRKPLLAALCSGVAVWAAGAAALAVFDEAPVLPTIVLHDLDGREVPLASFSGRPVVVNLWASWCPPCRREMPVLQDAQHDNPAVVFIFANQGESADTIRRYLEADKLRLENVLVDTDGKAARALGSAALPSTFFFDSNGNHVGTRIGELSTATLAQRVRTLAQ